VLIQMSRLGPASIASGVDLDGLKVVLQTAARAMDLPEQTVTVVTLTGDEHLREYNSRYRGLDEPTDVLAFAAREQPTDTRFQSPPGTEDWLGDIVISVPLARRQAREAGHPVNAELRLLAVHGFLHLLGYDHAEPEEEATMTALTNRILTQAP
jgi:probable rRNA maturation factor